MIVGVCWFPTNTDDTTDNHSPKLCCPICRWIRDFLIFGPNLHPWDHLYRWFNDSTMMPWPPSARTALLKKQRSDDENNRDLAESTFFSSFEMIGSSREEQIANVECQISRSFPSGDTWNYQGFEDSKSDAAYVLEILERDSFENPGMWNSYNGLTIQESTMKSM